MILSCVHFNCTLESLDCILFLFLQLIQEGFCIKSCHLHVHALAKWHKMLVNCLKKFAQEQYGQHDLILVVYDFYPDNSVK